MAKSTTILLIAFFGFFSSFSQTDFKKKNEEALQLLHKAKFEEAQKLIDEVLAQSSSNSIEYAEAKYIAGEEKMILGKYSEALKDFNTAKEINKKNNRQELLAKNLSDIGVTYWKLGNQASSLEYLQLSASIRKNMGLDKQLGDSYNNIGLIYSATDIDQSINYYTLAKDQYNKSLGKDHPNYLITENNIAIAKRNKGLYNEAIICFDNTLQKWETLYGKNSPKTAFIAANLGQCYAGLREYENANKSYNKAIDIYVTNYGNKHPELASTYNLLASSQSSNGDYKQAKLTIEKAIESNTKANSNDHLDNQLMIASLEEKGEIYINSYKNKTLSPKELKTALKTLDLCSEYIDIQRRLLISKKDKIALGAISSEVYDNAIECIIILKDEFLANKDFYNQKLFDYIEKSKGAVLLNSMQDAQAKEFANIPNHLLDVEKKLVATINILHNQLAQATIDDESGIRQQLDQANQTYTDFVTKLEQDFPEYYELKYSTKTITLKEAQDHLTDKQMIVDYFTSEKNDLTVVMKITCSNTKTESIRHPKNFERIINGFSKSISFSNLSIFKYASFKLCNSLGLNKIKQNISDLIIIPDTYLSSLPFEALITEKPESEDKFSNLNYLIKEKNISYHYSTSLWVSSEETKVSNRNITIFAPINFEQDFNIPDLPASSIEVITLDSLFHSNGYTSKDFVKKQASETSLHQNLSGSILHLPTHGTVNKENPELSLIYLAKDDKNDGKLYSGEIYSLSIDYDLVTLSACETGLGKVSKGEGIIGLSRALLYAGANNIAVSFWKVNDKSTSQFMIDFYSDYLTQKKSFHSSLQVAKIKMINSSDYSSPYYWAPFVLIGR